MAAGPLISFLFLIIQRMIVILRVGSWHTTQYWTAGEGQKDVIYFHSRANVI